MKNASPLPALRLRRQSLAPLPSRLMILIVSHLSKNLSRIPQFVGQRENIATVMWASIDACRD